MAESTEPLTTGQRSVLAVLIVAAAAIALAIVAFVLILAYGVVRHLIEWSLG